jgi:hypothetical protein
MPSRNLNRAPPTPGTAGAAGLPPPKPRRPPPENSLFRRNIPCSGQQNSLFRPARELTRKPLKSLHDSTTAAPK